jgi:hypothetical protein
MKEANAVGKPPLQPESTGQKLVCCKVSGGFRSFKRSGWCVLLDRDPEKGCIHSLKVENSMNGQTGGMKMGTGLAGGPIIQKQEQAPLARNRGQSLVGK